MIGSASSSRARLADLLVIRSRGGAPYETVVTSTPADVMLVAVSGVPLYGDPTLMTTLLPGKKLEELTVCGEKKLLFLDSALPGERWKTVRRQLEAELQRYASNLAPIECGSGGFHAFAARCSHHPRSTCGVQRPRRR